MIRKMPHYGYDLANKLWAEIIKNVWNKLNEIIDYINNLGEQMKPDLPPETKCAKCGQTMIGNDILEIHEHNCFLKTPLCGKVKPKKCIHICPICDDEAEPPEYEKCKIPNCECGGEAILNAEAEPKGFYDDTHNKDRCHPTSESEVERILKLLNDIDGYAADSRGCYENARGNDACCYEATQKIREILKPTISAKG